MPQLWRDARHALQVVGGRPLEAWIAVLTLALGIGATTTAFALVHGLLAPLDYPEADRLVRIHRTLEPLRDSPNARLAAMWDRIPVSYLFAQDLRASANSLARLGLYEGSSAVIEGGREPERVGAARLGPDLLDVLGVSPVLGPGWSQDDGEAGGRQVLLGHELWTGAFGADRDVIGRSVRVDGEPHVVVGVMPEGFDLPGRDGELWLPLRPSGDDLSLRDDHRYTAVARLAPGVSPAEAGDELARISARLARQYPATDAGAGVRSVPLLDTVVGDHRRFLGFLLLAAGLVLAVACLNVTHLLLAWGQDRRRDLAVRLTLGARRSRLVASLSLEALWIAVGGGLAGMLLAAAGIRVLPRLLADELPRLDGVVLDGGVLLFSLGVTALSALAAGVAPALSAAEVHLRSDLTSGGAGSSSGSPRGRRRSALLILVEVAFTMILVCAAAFLALNWLRLVATDPGFEAEGVLVQELELPAWSYPDGQDRIRLAEVLLDRLAAVPGVTEVALTSRLPVSGPVEVWGFRIAGRDPPGGDWTRGRSAGMQVVTPGYFDLLRIPTVAGRLGKAAGTGRGVPIVWIDRSLAERHWPEGGEVGARILLRGQAHTVAGVAEDVQHLGVGHPEGDLLMLPWEQSSPAEMAILLRTDGDPMAMAPRVRRVLRGIDPGLPLPAAERLSRRVAGALGGPRARAWVVALSAGMALLLAAAGLYGMVSRSVVRRRRELAVRMALGAGPAEIHRSVLAGALAPVAAGVTLGAGAVLLGARYAEGVAWALEPAGALLAAVVGALLLLVCLAAAWLPARRAARTDPAAVLTGDAPQSARALSA